MKKNLVAVGAVLVLVIVGLAILPGFVDWGKYKPLIAAKVQAQTGYTLTLGGDLDIRLLPAPHLVVQNLSLTPPGAAAPLISLERADVQVALLPLLAGHVVVDSVAMIRPHINLLIDAGGRAAWMTPQVREKIGAPSAAAPNGARGGRFALRDIYIKEAAISYIDKRMARDYVLSDVDLTIHGDGLYGPYDVEGTLNYLGKPLRLSVKTKAVDDAAQTVDLDSQLSLAGIASLSYKGLAGLKAPMDLQGEAKLETPSLKKLIDFAHGGQSSLLLDKPVSAEGLVSLAASKASWSNMRVRFGNAGFSGNVAAANIQAGAAAPVDLTLSLAADKPVDLTPWTGEAMPVRAVDGPPAAGGAAAIAAPADFLPAQVTLPRLVTFNAAVTAPAATYKNLTLNNVSLTVQYKDRQGAGAFKADIPGGTAETDFNVAFASAGKTEDGGIVLAGPALTYAVALRTTDGAQALTPFVPAERLATFRPLLQGPVSLDASGDIKGRMVDLGNADLTIGGNSLHLQGAYTPLREEGRDALSITATADRIDLDQWLLRLPETPDATEPQPAAKADAKAAATDANAARAKAIRAAALKLVLPFDLDLSATADKLRFKGTDYQKFSLLAALRGPSLALKTIQVNDPDGNSLVAAGSVGDLTKLQNVDVSLQGQTNDMKAILTAIDPKWKTAPDSLQFANVVAEVKGDASAASFTANVKAMDGTLDVTGALAQPLDDPAVTALTFRLRHPSFVDLARLVQPDFTANVAIRKTVDLFVSLKRDKQIYTFSDLQGEIGPASFTGDMTVDMAGARPAVKARLQMTDVPLSDLIGHGSTEHPGNAVAISGASGNSGNSSAPAPAQGHWSRNPVNVAWMRKIDADVTASVHSLTYGTWTLDNGAADVTLKDGVLTLAKLTGGLYGGTASLTGKLTAPAAAGGALAVTGDVDLENVALQPFMNAFSASHVVDGRGNVSLKGNIDSTGSSPAELIGALAGKGTLAGKNILFNGFDLERFSRTLVQPGSSIKNDLSDFGASLHGGSTAFNTADGAFTIAKGVLTLDPMKLTGDAATVTAPGTIDLPLWQIDMTATVQLARPADAPPLTVAIKGPLGQPAKAFGQSALKSYAASRLASLLQKTGLAPAAGGTAVKPKDLLKNVLNNALKQ